MESRLPKPKALVHLKKTIESGETRSETIEMSNTSNALLKPTAKTATLVSDLKTIGKSKSTLNVNANSSNENKPPTKQLLTRSQTSVAIARTNQPRVAVKRLAGAANAIEAKRANIGAVVRSTLTQRAGRAGASSATTAKATAATAGASRPATKPSKWDLKGRLEWSNAELATLKEKYKKSAQLETIVNELRAKETQTSLKIEKLEDTNAALSDELATTKRSYADLLQNHDALKLKLEQTEESLEVIRKILRETEETCEAQKALISENSSKMASMEESLSASRLEGKNLSEKLRDLRSLVHGMDRDRRYLHNAIQELKGNIRVFCRVRPRIERETSKIVCSINFIDESTMEISRAEFNEGASNCGGKTRCAKQEFTFDKIFPPSATQAHVFEELSMLVQSALEGYNVCVFAYGQTGSGKTYTMEGGELENNEGMIPRTVRHIFEEMKQFELLGWEYRIEASFLEIYNEHIVDLLDSQTKNHEIRMADSKGNDLFVTNLQIAEIHSPEELHVCLRTAQKNRAVAATFSNERSSRSHSVTRIRLIGRHAGKDEQSIGNLNLVDLAGSERLKGEEAIRTAETKNINKSLANLGNVILALLKKQDHVPYRNSKLTHLLMPSLGGNSKTLMLLNVSPLDECFGETLNSLRFASNVNSCKTGNVKRARTIINNPL